MPESMSIERRRLMAAYGAQLELTPREMGMKGAIEKARQMVRTEPGAWMPMQFANPRQPPHPRRNHGPGNSARRARGLRFFTSRAWAPAATSRP